MGALISHIVAIGGAVGAGKSSVAIRLYERFIQHLGLGPDSHNSIRLLRSDAFRKQLLGIELLSRLPKKYHENERYSRLVYNTLHEVAGAAIDVGDIVLLDATYSRKWQRDELKRLAGDRGFQGYWLDTSIDERLKRLSIRGLDVSDAGPDFAIKQNIERPVCEASWECLNTDGVGLDELAETLFARVCADKI